MDNLLYILCRISYGNLEESLPDFLCEFGNSSRIGVQNPHAVTHCTSDPNPHSTVQIESLQIYVKRSEKYGNCSRLASTRLVDTDTQSNGGSGRIMPLASPQLALR